MRCAWATNDEVDIRRCQGIVVAPETVTDVLVLSGQRCWDERAVWWEEAARDSLHEHGANGSDRGSGPGPMSPPPAKRDGGLVRHRCGTSPHQSGGDR